MEVDMQLKVCVGSSCHLKGSYGVINTLKDLIEKNNLQDKLELSASFCLGKCSEGVSMKLGDEFILNASEQNIEDIFYNTILPKLS
ncbi:MAG: NAD(P)H-dependent oxidoreductase subunit E [Clostridia bacterium]